MCFLIFVDFTEDDVKHGECCVRNDSKGKGNNCKN